MDETEFGMNEKFVDIHGREIPAVVVGSKHEIAFPLTELNQTGVAIFQKSQYAKLSNTDMKFDNDFIDFMLESAKTYMLQNKISFTQDQILSSIENCKATLKGDKNPAPQKQPLFKDRSVAKGSDDGIIIQVTNKPTHSQSPNIKLKSPNLKNIYPKLHHSINTDLEATSLTSNINNDDIKVKENGNLEKSKNGSVITTPTDYKSKGKHLSNQIQLDVVVTHIDKKNCIWVRDKANDAVLCSIHNKINEEAKYQKVPPKPWSRDQVYLAQDEGLWFRCKIVRFAPLTVFFLDYGNIAKVDIIKEASEELTKIPSLAIRITFKTSEYVPVLEDEIRIKCFVQNEDGTFFVNVLGSSKPKNTELTVPEVRPQITNKTEISPEPRKIQEFFKKPPYLTTIANDQTVALVKVKNGIFYLRTKDCFAKLKEVESAIGEYVKDAKNLENPKPDQLVLYQDVQSGKWKRAVVLKVENKKTEIESIDYVERRFIHLGSLKTISEELSKEPITYFSGGFLLGFEDSQLDESCNEIIEQHIAKRTKFRVVLGFDDELDLLDGTQLLSEQLTKASNTSQRVYLKDISYYKPQFVLKSYLCGYFKSSNDFALLPSDELREHIDYILRSELEDNEPYTPVIQEVCLCYFVDQWYRCVVTRIFEKECEVLLLDFGNVELIRKENLRKPDDQVTKIPALALPCKLFNAPIVQDIESVLKKLIIEGEVYNAVVVKIMDGKCYVELPSVYQAMRNV